MFYIILCRVLTWCLRTVLVRILQRSEQIFAQFAKGEKNSPEMVCLTDAEAADPVTPCLPEETATARPPKMLENTGQA
ncbi:hypothetical protein AVEN_61530-1 [Araneus ventricosus]|uniref:Uncharacterized protein n=1 Tax=Araneus ventricosus TaxID=182803 RepID=A0A4Y2IA09_ARAVE|nr:hypothetical protein AVEN_61530-1 [Araneus ventricosus]